MAWKGYDEPILCSVNNCDRIHYAKGMCQVHYMRIVQGYKKPLDSPIRESNRKGNRLCSLNWCELKHYAKGYCHGHYERSRQGIPLDLAWGEKRPRPPKEIPDCKAEGCRRVAEAKGLCKGHWQQQHIGRTLSPLRKNIKGFADDEGRVCTECMEYKTWDNFYNRSKPDKTRTYKQSVCKPCMIARAGENQRRRRGR